MAIKFGKDGTIYCNTVRYNYKQARNLIADGCGAQSSGVWTLTNMSHSSLYAGYKTNESFIFQTKTTSMMEQPMPTPIAGHKYYGGLMFKSVAGQTLTTGDDRFEWYCADSSDGTMVFANKTVTTNGNWIKLSSVKSLSSVRSGSWRIRNFFVQATAQAYCTKMIIIDLTEAFGAGNEPTKEWCDNNIREWETYTNFGTMSPNITKSNYTTAWTFGGAGSVTRYNYLALNSTYEPREYMYSMLGSTSDYEQTLTNAGYELNTSKTHYAYIEQLRPYNYANESGHDDESFDFYYPVAEPGMGHIRAVDNIYFSAGKMNEWKRTSAYNVRPYWSNGTKYPFRIDFNNMRHNSVSWWTALSFLWADSVLAKYNSYNGTSVPIGDINKEWCDRWVDARSSPIIHVKDHKNQQIKLGGRESYTQLEYIESSGYQYIDTKVRATDVITRIEGHVYKTSPAGTSGILFGLYGGGNDLMYLDYSENGTTTHNTLFGYGSYAPLQLYTSLSNAAGDKKIVFTHSGTSFTYSVNGTTASGTSSAAFGTSYNHYLFAYNSQGSAGYFYDCRMYSFKIWVNNTLVRDFIPVRRNSDGAVGLLDKVGGKFYSSDSDVPFIAGPAVAMLTDYDIICNDIEIRPELNKVVFEKTGTIKCKKLVREQEY